MTDDAGTYADLCAEDDDHPVFRPDCDARGGLAELAWDADAVGWCCPAEGCEYVYFIPGQGDPGDPGWF